MVTSSSKEAAARILALVVASKGCVDPQKLSALQLLDAFDLVGVSAARFAEIANELAQEFGGACECSWLPAREEAWLDEWLDAIQDTQSRRLVCRLARVAMQADHQVTNDERLLYEHVLAHWHIDSAEFESELGSVS